MRLYLKNEEFERVVLPLFSEGELGESDIYTVDTLAHRAGEKDPRVLLALAFALREPRYGHVGMEFTRLAQRLLASRKDYPQETADKLAPQEWKTLVAGSRLVDSSGRENRPFVLLDAEARPDNGSRAHRLLSRRYCELEKDVAEMINRRLEQEPRKTAARDISPGVRLEPAQEQAVAAVLGQRLVVLTGGPGSGKTFTLKFMLQAWWQEWQAGRATPGQPQVALAAPTGKAAARITESLREDLDEYVPQPPVRRWLETLEACTLHRLLGASFHQTGHFFHNRGNPLPQQLVIIDEASMVDLEMMYRLLAALRSDATLVLVGDADQLASVEAGCVLGDLVRGLAGRRENLFRLTRSHRAGEGSALQELAGTISAIEHDEGALERALELLRTGRPEIEFLSFRGRNPPGEHLERLAEGYRRYAGSCVQGAPAGKLLEEFSRYRILTPFRRGAAGVAGLNHSMEQLLRELTGAGAGHRGLTGCFSRDRLWYNGRPVLITENRYDLGLMNGDVGIVVPSGRDLVVAFPDAGTGASGSSVRQYAPAVLPACETVLAMTVHKSQGSEFEQVALVVPGHEAPILTRELIYTAVTRARQRLLVLGDGETLRQALARPIQRASGLDRRLAGRSG